jgi:hypothetical protein
MNLLQICQALAKNVGLAVPSSIVGSNDRNAVESLQLANEAGLELAERVDWSALTTTTTFAGTGADTAYALPVAWMRPTAGGGVRYGTTILRPLTAAEWATTTPAAGAPRYHYISGRTIKFYLYPQVGMTVTARYQSNEWASTGSQFTADDATPLVPADVLVKGLIARWRRQKGMEYQDQEAEYEATLQNYARFEDGGRG